MKYRLHIVASRSTFISMNM